MSLVILCGNPGVGKTSLMTALARDYAFDRERNLLMLKEIAKLNAGGWNFTMPEHCVFSNIPMTLRKFGYSPRQSYFFNPYRFGFDNPNVETDIPVSHGVYFVVEAQEFLNSRMSFLYPAWQSRAFEQHRHLELEFYFDVQRAMLVDVNIRALCEFWDIVKLEINYDEFGKPCKLVWTYRYVENNSMFERYMSSGKTDTSCYEERQYVFNGNIFEMYNSKCCEPDFYRNKFERDFNLTILPKIEKTVESYKKYLESNEHSLPDGFYVKRSNK